MTDLLTYIERGGLVGVLLFILLTGMRQIWVWGWLYKQAISDRDEWKIRSLKTLDIIEKALESSRGGGIT